MKKYTRMKREKIVQEDEIGFSARQLKQKGSRVKRGFSGASE